METETPTDVLTIEPDMLTFGRYVLRSEKIGELAKALAKAQKAIQAAKKDKTNPHFKASYADLASIWDACREPLTANGFSVLQPPTSHQNRVTVTTVLLHESGQWVASELEMASGSALPQAIGSTITYARRYALAAMAGVAPEDDDATAGSEQRGPQAEDKRPSPAQRKSQAQPPPEPPPYPPPAMDFPNQDRMDIAEPVAAIVSGMEKKAKAPNPVLHIGVIATVEERPVIAGNPPRALITLDTGFMAGAKGKDFIASAIRLRDSQTRVELVTEPSKMGANYAPNVTEMLPRP